MLSKSAYRTSHNTLAAVDASGFSQRPAKGCGNHSIKSPFGEANGTHCLHRAASADAASAEDAFGGVTQNGR
ncbi:hypothetical protein D3C75_1209020 [compost metagenome]